jgi:hypothetical protein
MDLNRIAFHSRRLHHGHTRPTHGHLLQGEQPPACSFRNTPWYTVQHVTTHAAGSPSTLTHQGRIKEFVGPRHFKSLGPFWDSKSTVGTTVYSRLSGLKKGDGMHGQLRNTDNPNFIFYTPTVPLARHRLRNVLFSHTSHITGRLIVDFWFLKK